MWLLTIIVIIIASRWYLRSKFGRCTSKRKLHGITAIVTGANTGIGKEVARELAKRGARVILGCRSIEKGEAAKREIIESTGNSNICFLPLELASLESVRKFAAEIVKNERRLDILVNNAAVAGTRAGKKTEDGLDLGLQVNHYAPFLLTNLLLDLLKKSAPSRIVFVSSLAHKYAKVDFKDLDKVLTGFNNYAVSKLFNILTSNSLAEALKGTGVTCNSVHPGAVNTDAWRNIPSPTLKAMIKWTISFFQKSPADGAEPVLDVAISENLEGTTGKYFTDCKENKTSEMARNAEYARILWKHSENAVKQEFSLKTLCTGIKNNL